MQLSYKFRAYPDGETERKLFHSLDLCRWLYNTLLGVLNDHRGEFGKEDTQAAITQIKQVYPELDDVHSKTLQMVNYRLWSAIKGLSKLARIAKQKKKGRRIGRLKYKKKGQYNSLEYNQSGFPIDAEKQMAWFSAMQVELPDVENKLTDIVESGEPISEEMLEGKKVVGIDVNIGSFTDYDGIAFHLVENPKMLDRKLDELRFRQRNLSWKKKGSNNRRKAGKLLLKVCPRNTTQRCSHCGSLVYKDITKRTHECPYCGLVIDRDENSAVNIRSDGITMIRAGNRPEPDGEARLCSNSHKRNPEPPGKQAPMKQEATAGRPW